MRDGRVIVAGGVSQNSSDGSGALDTAVDPT